MVKKCDYQLLIDYCFDELSLDIPSLSSKQLRVVEGSYGFAVYRCNIRFKELITEIKNIFCRRK